MVFRGRACERFEFVKMYKGFVLFITEVISIRENRFEVNESK